MGKVWTIVIPWWFLFIMINLTNTECARYRKDRIFFIATPRRYRLFYTFIGKKIGIFIQKLAGNSQSTHLFGPQPTMECPGMSSMAYEHIWSDRNKRLKQHSLRPSKILTKEIIKDISSSNLQILGSPVALKWRKLHFNCERPISWH